MGVKRRALSVPGRLRAWVGEQMIAIRPEAGSSGMPPTPSCPKGESLERCPKAHQAPTSTHAPWPASQAGPSPCAILRAPQAPLKHPGVVCEPHILRLTRQEARNSEATGCWARTLRFRPRMHRGADLAWHPLSSHWALTPPGACLLPGSWGSGTHPQVWP